MKVAHAIRKATAATREFLLENSLEILPARRHWAHYSWPKARRDAVAGANVALLSIAQGLAFAAMAGVPIAHGVTCAAVASLVGPLLASSRHTILGPTNATAFLVFSAMAGLGAGVKAEVLPVLIFISGALLVVGAYIRLADLLQYVSRSVVVGYLSGSCLLIIANQVGTIIGAKLSQGPQTFFTIVASVVRQIPHVAVTPLVTSVATLLLYVFFRKKTPRLPAFAMVLAIAAVVNVGLERAGIEQRTLEPFSLRDLVPAVPDLRDPGLWQQVSPLFGVAMAMAFLAALENSIMAKTLASRTGDRLDGNQEMLSVGVANLACSFLSGMPASGSLTRSALNHASGAHTQASSMVSGVLCAAGAVTLSSVAGHMPKSVLATLVICVAASLINRRHIRMCLRATRSDASTLLITFFSALLMPLQLAIFVGVAVSIVLYLRKASQPELVEYEFNPHGHLNPAAAGRQHPSISIVHVEGELFFGAAELFRTQVQRLAADTNLRVIILRMKNARHLDATSVMALEELILFMRSKNRHLLISGALKDVYRVLKNSGLIDILGRENVFPGSIQNPNLATRNALKRAQQLLGTTEAEVHIYYDPNKASASAS